MHWLMFDLAGPLASFGGVAPGSVRDTDLLPTRAAVLGLLAAAQGIARDDVAGQRALGEGLLLAARANAHARLLRDYHTAQAPSQAALKGRPRATRRDELLVPRDDLNAVLSDRYYYTDYAATIGVGANDAAKLDGLQQALRAPKFTLYLGRKSCPPAWPLAPRRLVADTWSEALARYDDISQADLAKFRRFGVVEHWLRGGRYHHSGDEGIEPGDELTSTRTVTRRDAPVDTARRLFSERRHWRAEQGEGGRP